MPDGGTLIEIVPMIGPVIGSLLVVAVGVPQSLHVAALSLLWLVVVREFQNYVVNPRICRTVGSRPSSRSSASRS